MKTDLKPIRMLSQMMVGEDDCRKMIVGEDVILCVCADRELLSVPDS